MPRKDLMEAAAFLAGYGASTYFLLGYIGISSRQRREIDSLQSVLNGMNEDDKRRIDLNGQNSGKSKNPTPKFQS